MIPVTKPYLPNREKLNRYIDGIYDNRWLTNNGPLLQQLTQRLEKYLGVENLLLVSNGTLALQVAYKALGISRANCKEQPQAITTPFTFVATPSSMQWEGIEPVFSDIDIDSWCLSTENIETSITDRTCAIVPVHVFGNACDVDTIESIAIKHKLKVVYDASHAFGVKYKGRSLLNWGDASTLSFHATKLFHTVEGGAIVFKRKSDLDVAKKMINFGLVGANSIEGMGINAKMNEFQAAVGLCVLDEIDANLAARKGVVEQYLKQLPPKVILQKSNALADKNYAYMPILLKDEPQLLTVLSRLKESKVIARRYFYPSLNEADCYRDDNMPVSESIANRIICLPLFHGLTESDITRITKIIAEIV